MPDASQRALIARHFAAEHTRQFQAQLDAIALPAAKCLDFDASKLSGIAALQQELIAVTVLAKAARNSVRQNCITSEAKVTVRSDWAGLEEVEPLESEDDPDLEEELDEEYQTPDELGG